MEMGMEMGTRMRMRDENEEGWMVKGQEKNGGWVRVVRGGAL